MNAPPLPPPDEEFALKASIGEVPVPRPDMGRITALLQEMQRQCAALDAHTLSATRSNCFDSAATHGAHAVMAAEAAALCILHLMQIFSHERATAKAAEQALRHAIGTALQSTGTLVFPLEFHNVESAAGAERVEVPEPGLLPEPFWRHVEPEPDKARIGAALKHGPVPGARHVRGPHTIRITQRKGLGQ